jgi:NAD(P)-dependent dehydrogenase (short-subunit alcohol dehydrogenase family)
MEAKIAIVTGAAKGIGLGIAMSLAGKGIVPVIADIDAAGAEAAAERIRKAGVPAAGFTVDVSAVDQVVRFVEAVAEKYGRVDILVNNAGILSRTPVGEITEAEWDRVMGINLKSALFASQQVLKHMIPRGWGRIVNIASMAGRSGGISTGCAYSASKAALIGMTRCMARQVAKSGVTVNALAPGPTETDLFQGFTPEERRNLADSIPVGKLGKPEQIGEAVVFLASEAAAFITGAVLDINGGLFMG